MSDHPTPFKQSLISARSLPLGMLLMGLLWNSGCLAEAPPGLFDPTRPADRIVRPEQVEKEAVVEPPPVRLQALFSRQGTFTALVDGAKVVIGDQIGSWLVKQIDNNGVLLVADGKQVLLTISNTRVRQQTQEKM